MSALMKPARRFKARPPVATPVKLLMTLLLALALSAAARAQGQKTGDAAPADHNASSVGQQVGQRPASAPATNKRANASAVTYGSINGRLTGDDGRPLMNAPVYIWPVGSLVPTPPRTSSTDASGKFEFTNLATGSYIIRARAPGYVILREGPDAAELPERVYYRLGDHLNLTMTKGGVITGTVTDAMGQAVVAIRVHVVRVRDASGKPMRVAESLTDMLTDDRGVYRAWGLEPGGYLISAGGDSLYFDNQSRFHEDSPTYYPSATRDGATEVTVRYGEEQSGIDIHYRNERGHRVSGTISGATDARSLNNSGINLSLIYAGTGLVEDVGYVWPDGVNAFTFSGLADGDYDVMARRGFGDDIAASAPLRIKVRGADITGLKLLLAPLGTITGRVLMEAPAAPPPPACEAKPKQPVARQRGLEETVVVALLDEKSSERLRSPLPTSLNSAPKSSGEFLFGGLQPGRYRLDARLPDERWYVRAITIPNAGVPSSTKSEADGGVLIGPGTQASGLTVALTTGAGLVAGRVVASGEGATLPAHLRLYLVPREADRADDLLRFGEVAVTNDGAFTFANLAPGRYWLIARPAPDAEMNDTAPVPLAWNREARSDLRRNAEAARQEIELQPCQQLRDVTVRYVPPATLNK